MPCKDMGAMPPWNALRITVQENWLTCIRHHIVPVWRSATSLRVFGQGIKKNIKHSHNLIQSCLLANTWCLNYGKCLLSSNAFSRWWLIWEIISLTNQPSFFLLFFHVFFKVAEICLKQREPSSFLLFFHAFFKVAEIV